MEKFYHFANVDLAIQIEDARMYQEDRNLAPFRAEPAPNPHRFLVEVPEQLPGPQGPELASYPGILVYKGADGYVRYQGPVQDGFTGAYARTEHHGKKHHIALNHVHTPQMVSARQVLNALDVEHLVASEGGVILHASYIVCQGRGILFTAPSETGKSTQAELWQIHRGARIINGDRAAVILRDGRICAAGLPFSGSSRYCENVTAPLAAVVYLRQAPVTTIRRLRPVEAFRRVWEGCCVNPWHRADVDRATGIVETLLGQVPVYELSCTPDETAVTALEAQIRKQVTL